MSRLHIADTGLFVAMGQPSNSRYQAVRRFARGNDITFVLPERVYEELTVDGPDIENPPVDTAIDGGWATGVDIYTTDIAAGEGAETALAGEGYGDSVTYVNGFRFIEDLITGNN